jgi:hypothetical protein
MAIYTTRIEADITDAPLLLATGNLQSERCRVRHFASDDPFPSHLFALVGELAR